MDQPDQGAKDFIEWFGALLILFLTVGGQAWRYLSEIRKNDPSPKHAILEAAEIADMNPIRELNKRIASVFPLIEKTNDNVEVVMRMLAEREKQEEIERKVQEAIHKERDREQREREGRKRD